ncbi:MAG: hypothetical protein CMH56_01015 [Myxococcales bacterium]|nr:hypothetical protein [Myxococcales bacterium]
MTMLRTLLFLSCAFTLIGCPGAPEEDPVKIEGDDAGECSDEADNDNDGLFDCDDEGCKGSPACKEEPATEGTGDGNTDGATEDAGSSDGSGEGNTDGATVDAGSSDGSGEGNGEGNTDGATADAGSSDGSGEGNGEGNNDGATEDAGSSDGAGEGNGEGNTDGATVDAGSSDGAGDGSTDGNDEDDGIPDYTCEVATDRIGELLSCDTDQNCPCGAHCVFSMCSFGCHETPSLCEDDKTCDFFGRCKENTSPNNAPGINAKPRIAVHVAPKNLSFVNTDTVQELSFNIDSGEDPQTIRIQAQQGLALNCDPDNSDAWEEEASADFLELNHDQFGPSCNVVIDSDKNVKIGVKALTLPARSGEPEEVESIVKLVHIFSENDHFTIPTALYKPETTIPETLTEGRYQGFYHLSEFVGYNATDWTNWLNESPNDTVKHPLIFDVFPAVRDSDLWAVRITDPTQFLLGKHEHVGYIFQGGPFQYFNIPASEYLSSILPGGGDSFTLYAQGYGRVQGQNAQSISGNLQIQIDGVTDSDFDVPYIDWSYAVHRTGDAEGIAPTANALEDEERPENFYTQLSGDLPWDAVTKEAVRGLEVENDSVYSDLRLMEWFYREYDGSLFSCEWEDDFDFATSFECGCGFATDNSFPTSCGILEDAGATCYPTGSNCGNTGGDFGFDIPGSPQTCMFYTSDLPINDDGYANNSSEKSFQCAQRYMCFAGENGDLDSSNLNNVFHSISGDLECNAGHAQSTFPILQKESTDEVLDALSLLQKCRADLARTPPDLTEDDFSEARGGLSAAGTEGAMGKVFDNAGCLSFPRFYRALHFASLNRDWFFIGNESTYTKSDKLFARLVGQWLQVNSFVANETRRQGELAQLFDDDQNDLEQMEATLDQLSDAIGFLLHPRIAHSLATLSTGAISNGDYREEFIVAVPVGEDKKGDVAIGIPTLMVETSTEILKLLEWYADKMRRKAYNGDYDLTLLLDAVHTTTRKILWVEYWARYLHQRTSNPSWGERFEDGLQNQTAIFRRINTIVESIRQGNNPLGIEESDLPLYLNSQTTGAGRHKAMSNYFLAINSSDNYNASIEVNQAITKVNDALNAYQALRDRTLQNFATTNDNLGRQESIKKEYGQRLSQLCGAELGTAEETFTQITQAGFEHTNCVFKDTAGCTVSEDDLFEKMSLSDIAFDFCMAKEIRQRTANGVSYDDPALNDLIEVLEANEVAYDTLLASLSASSNRMVDLALTELAEVNVISIDKRSLLKASIINIDRVLPEIYQRAQAKCRSEFPEAQTQLPSIADLEDGPMNKQECYRAGALGQMALSIQGASTDFELAKTQINELTDQYDHAVTGCLMQQATTNAVADASAAHAEKMQGWRAAQGVLNAIGSIAGALVKPTPAAIVGGIAGGYSAIFGTHMANLDQQHQRNIQNLQALGAHQLCLHNAKAHLNGMKSAQLRIEKSLNHIEALRLQYRGHLESFNQMKKEGQAALARQIEREMPVLATDFWAEDEDNKIKLAMAQMNRARRAVWFGLRAVEYEQQMTINSSHNDISIRESILTTNRPDDLNSVLTSLRGLTTSMATQDANETSPALSLRTDIFNYRFDSQAQLGHPMTSKEAFRAHITNPKFAVFENGIYKGQRIPFTLMPNTGDHYDNGWGNGPISRDICAERLWSVSVSIEGDRVFTGAGETAQKSIVIRKHGDFGSRPCEPTEAYPIESDANQPDPYTPPIDPVFTSARFKHNLFLTDEEQTIPEEPYEWTASALALGSPLSSHTATITTNFAAQGLFGKYDLFFNKVDISDDGGPGICLRCLDDIKLHFTYLYKTQEAQNASNNESP